jgi:hypothetical protein
LSQDDPVGRGYFLLDWDNVIGRLFPSYRGDRLRLAASKAALPVLAAEMAQLAKSEGLRAIDVLLYGGWNLRDGSDSRLASGLAPELRRYRRLVAGVALRPELRTTTFALVAHQLVGLLRPTPAPARQKMVDTMLALDAIFAVTRLRVPVWVVSEDDDLVPALAEAGPKASASFTLLRDGRSPNHVLLRRNRVALAGSLGSGLVRKVTPWQVRPS